MENLNYKRYRGKLSAQPVQAEPLPLLSTAGALQEPRDVEPNKLIIHRSHENRPRTVERHGCREGLTEIYDT